MIGIGPFLCRCAHDKRDEFSSGLGHEFESRLKWKISNFPHHLWLWTTEPHYTHSQIHLLLTENTMRIVHLYLRWNHKPAATGIGEKFATNTLKMHTSSETIGAFITCDDLFKVHKMVLNVGNRLCGSHHHQPQTMSIPKYSWNLPKYRIIWRDSIKTHELPYGRLGLLVQHRRFSRAKKNSQQHYIFRLRISIKSIFSVPLLNLP